MWVVLCNTSCFDQSQVMVVTDLISFTWNAIRKNKGKKQTFVAKMCNCDQFEIKIYLSENCFWNAKCHFMFLHDLNWLISEMMTQSDKISIKQDPKECHSSPSLPFLVSITYFKAVFIQQMFTQCTIYQTSLRY